jgi:hypothetical protein
MYKSVRWQQQHQDLEVVDNGSLKNMQLLLRVFWGVGEVRVKQKV